MVVLCDERPQPTTPQPSPLQGSRDDWPGWRYRRGFRASGTGWTWFWGVALILVGGYYLLKNLGLLEWVRGDVIWPLLVIALGIWLIVARVIQRPSG
jgi:hypothetical protein